jgi:uncharacterized membrane protein
LLALRIYVGRIFRQTAPMSHLHYLPLAPRFFAILVGFFFIVLILRSVRYAYESLGVSSNTAIFLLLATLIGSFFNIALCQKRTHAPQQMTRMG